MKDTRSTGALEAMVRTYVRTVGVCTAVSATICFVCDPYPSTTPDMCCVVILWYLDHDYY